MLAADLAVFPAALNQAHCQPIGRVAKVHDHCSGTITVRVAFLRSEERRPLAAPASSSRTLFHVWMAPTWQEITSRAAQKSLAVFRSGLR